MNPCYGIKRSRLLPTPLSAEIDTHSNIPWQPNLTAYQGSFNQASFFFSPISRINGRPEMNRKKSDLFKWILFSITLLTLVTGCSAPQPAEQTKPVTEDVIVLGAYTVPKEAYQKEIIPAFKKLWKEKTGRDVIFEESYVGSGAQARAIVGGFEADVAALSLEGDIDRITEAGLITHNWKERKYAGFITNSIVVIGYRDGNPKDIHDWEDLTRDDIDLICPNPKTSGGAQWFINAAYGAGLMMTEKEKGISDSEYARDLLKRILMRIKVMNNSGRSSVTTYERGVGDAILTYENEALLRQMQGRSFEFAIPKATILIQNPVALVDKYADKHGTREVASAFIDFLETDFSQRALARYGFRSVNSEIAGEFADKYPEPEYLFDMSYLGGWTQVNIEIYGSEGLWTQLTQQLNLEKILATNK